MPISNTCQRPCRSFRACHDGSSAAIRPRTEGQPASRKRQAFGIYLLSLPIWAYRWLISPWIGPRCRYLPTCSDYALDALAQHGAIKGGWFAIRRLGRCHPFGGQGFDPVPPKGPSDLTEISSGCDHRKLGADRNAGSGSRTQS